MIDRSGCDKSTLLYWLWIFQNLTTSDILTDGVIFRLEIKQGFKKKP